MPRRILNEALDEALDRKMEADLALYKLRSEASGDFSAYSESRLLSALERCDEAMDGVWKAAKTRMIQAAE